MRVFYADDDIDEITIFSEALSSIDKTVECITAPDGDEALRILSSSNRFDFIFLDMNMPRHSGRDCLIAIRNNRAFDGIPVIIYSSTISKHDEQVLLKQGASAVLSKKSDIIELTKELNKIFGKDRHPN